MKNAAKLRYRNEGWDCYCNGGEPTQCPYDRDTLQEKHWLNGYEAAELFFNVELK